jgi:hypothetical protein
MLVKSGFLDLRRSRGMARLPATWNDKSSFLRAMGGAYELWPAHCITPRNALHGPTASRY